MLDPEGVWDDDMIGFMLTVAIEVEADQTEAMFGAVAAAVSGLFQKDASSAFMKGIEAIRKQVRSAQYASRGVQQPRTYENDKGEDPASALLKGLQQMGVTAKRVPRKPKARAGAKPGKGKPK